MYQLLVSIFVLAIGIWMIQKANAIKHNKSRSAGSSIGMCLLYFIGGLFMLGFVSTIFQLLSASMMSSAL